MKRELYYCDRCGKEMKPHQDFMFMRTFSSAPIQVTWSEPKADSYVSMPTAKEIRERVQEAETKRVSENAVIVKVDVDTYFRANHMTYELCPDCLWKLKQFMKGKR